MDLTQDMDQWRALENTAMNLNRVSLTILHYHYRYSDTIKLCDRLRFYAVFSFDIYET
jgi:hypothetical protein